jgi:hypothetical protein
LGIDLEKGKKIYLVSIGGRILGYLHEVSLSLGNKTFLCKVVLLSNIIFHSICLAEIIFLFPLLLVLWRRKERLELKSKNNSNF